MPGSFYWLADNLDLTQVYTLVLIDRHSDMSAIGDIWMRSDRCW